MVRNWWENAERNGVGSAAGCPRNLIDNLVSRSMYGNIIKWYGSLRLMQDTQVFERLQLIGSGCHSSRFGINQWRSDI